MISHVSPPLFKSWVAPPQCHPGGSASKSNFCSDFSLLSEVGNEGINCLHSSLWWSYVLQANGLDTVQWDEKPDPFHIGFNESISNGFHHQTRQRWWLYDLLQQWPGLSTLLEYKIFLWWFTEVHQQKLKKWRKLLCWHPEPCYGLCHIWALCFFTFCFT